MSINIKKKTIKIISAIIIVLLIIVVSAVIIGVVLPRKTENQIRETLSQINAEELQEKMIKELEKSSLNINTEEITTTIGTLDDAENNNKYIKNNINLLSGVKANYELSHNLDIFKNYISAYIIGKNNEVIVIPCFKIESDTDGNFKSIKCKSTMKSHNIPDLFVKVLDEQFGIKLEGKYRSEILKSDKDDIVTYTLKDEDLIDIAKKYLNWYGAGTTSQQVQLIKEDCKLTTIFEID